MNSFFRKEKFVSNGSGGWQCTYYNECVDSYMTIKQLHEWCDKHNKNPHDLTEVGMRSRLRRQREFGEDRAVKGAVEVIIRNGFTGGRKPNANFDRGSDSYQLVMNAIKPFRG